MSLNLFNLSGFMLLSLFFSTFSFNHACAQSPEIDWEHLYCDASNTSNEDGSFALTPDGGAVMVSVAYNGMECGDKNEFGNGAEDYWVVKVDSAFNIQWQNNIGGSGNDIPWCINPTNDGGYIVAGVSNSPVSGDKTEGRIDLAGPYYSDDLWILKLDSVGNIVWQNTIGGNEYEARPYIEQLPGGGYILCCSSNSPISGDKMEGNFGGAGYYDFWIIKLNNSGNIVWQNTLGGGLGDYARDIHPVPGGFICSGISYSPANGDKTSAETGGWILKLNNAGNILWQNTVDMFAEEIHPEADGTFMVGGTTIHYYGYENAKYALIRLNASGSEIWSRIIDADYSVLRSFDKTLDGGYVLGGTSVGSGTEKTDVGPIPTYYAEGWDMWLIKIDSLGNYQWDNALGSASDDGGAIIRQKDDGNYLLYGFANNDEEGDVSDKANPNEGQWLVHLINTACVEETEICNGLDDNCNGTIDDGAVDSIAVTADGPLSFCQGGSVTLTANYYTGTALQWKKNGEDIPGATNVSYIATKAATYTCQTTSACSFAISAWQTVKVYKNPMANITADGATTFCPGDSVTLSVSPVAACSYQWYKGATAISGATSAEYVVSITGNYRCLVTKLVSGCYKYSNAIPVYVNCREDDALQKNSTFSVYPNPANDVLHVSGIAASTQGSNAPVALSIFNDLGMLVYTAMVSNEVMEIDISRLPAGIYFIQLQDSEFELTKNFIKE